MKKILSIDGGGIRGIIPGQVLIALETKLQQKTNNPNARIAEFFDFFAGTSTGGILTCILLCPDENDPTKARFSAQEAVNLYIQNGDGIFDAGFLAGLRSVFWKSKYKASGIETVLAKYFSELKLNQLLKPCIVPSYDIGNRETKFFAQHDYAKLGDKANFLVKDVCRATSAAPTYFQPELITSLSGDSYACVDGGMFANNPALCAYSEVRNAKGYPTAKDMFVVSIGTGSANKLYPYAKAKNWGDVSWVQPVIDIMMGGAAEVTDYHLQKMFSAQNHQANYIRIQPNSLGGANPEMDDASKTNIDALVKLGTETAQNCPELDRIVDVLVTGSDPVEF